MGQPTLEIWAHQLWKYGPAHIANMGAQIVDNKIIIMVSPDWQYGPTHFGNLGEPIFPKWAHLWCVVLCGFGETILEIWVSQYFQNGRAHIGKIDNTL